MKNLLILAIILLTFSFANAQSDWKLFGMGIVKNDISHANSISSPDLRKAGRAIINQMHYEDDSNGDLWNLSGAIIFRNKLWIRNIENIDIRNLAWGILTEDISYIEKITRSDLKLLGRGIVYRDISYINRMQ
jgi:hypothetical protein